MTREERREAIEYLKKYKELDKQLYQTAPFTSVSHNALVKCLRYWDAAIQALEQGPCEDAISRQAVIKVLINNGVHFCDMVKITSDIKDLPPVNPQEPKAGHWITTPREAQLFDWIDFGVEEKTYYITCSECGYQFASTSKMTNYRFCPKCGCKMESEEE